MASPYSVIRKSRNQITQLASPRLTFKGVKETQLFCIKEKL